jgi:Peptidase family S41
MNERLPVFVLIDTDCHIADINSTGGYTPSELVKIDGQDVNTYLAQFPYGLQDKDASYNSNFFNPATWLVWQRGTFARSIILNVSDTSTYSFANGSSTTLPNNVIVRISLSKIQSGQDIYNDFIFVSDPQAKKKTKRTLSGSMQQISERDSLPLIQERATDPTISSVSFSESIPTATVTSAQGSVAATSSTLASFGYPSPVAISPDFSVAGYFLDNEPETAILNIIRFTNEAEGSALPFQETITNFLAACSSQGKKKLIVDVRGNPGGTTMTAYDAFKQIFPTQPMNTRIRLRDHPITNAMGTIISQFGDPVSLQNYLAFEGAPTATNGALLFAKDSVYNVANNLMTPDGQPYANWGDFYGPVTFNGDSFSNYYSLDFANPGFDLWSGGGIIVSGYANDTNLPPQVFNAKNITLVSYRFAQRLNH